MAVTELTKITWNPGTPDGLTEAELRALGFSQIEPGASWLGFHAEQPEPHWNYGALTSLACCAVIWIALGVRIAG